NRGPGGPRAGGRCGARWVGAGGDRLAVICHTPQHGVDELVVAFGLRVVLGERHGKVDGRVRRGSEKDELGRAGEHDWIERARFLGEPALEEGEEHVVKLTLAPEARGNNGAGERTDADWQIEHPASFEPAAGGIWE